MLVRRLYYLYSFWNGPCSGDMSDMLIFGWWKILLSYGSSTSNAPLDRMPNWTFESFSNDLLNQIFYDWTWLTLHIATTSLKKILFVMTKTAATLVASESQDVCINKGWYFRSDSIASWRSTICYLVVEHLKLKQDARLSTNWIMKPRIWGEHVKTYLWNTGTLYWMSVLDRAIPKFEFRTSDINDFSISFGDLSPATPPNKKNAQKHKITFFSPFSLSGDKRNRSMVP